MKKHIFFIALQTIGVYNNLLAMEKKESELTKELWQKTDGFKTELKQESEDTSLVKRLDPKDYDHVAVMLCLNDIIKNESKRSGQDVASDVKTLLQYMEQNKYDINKEFFKLICLKGSTDILDPYVAMAKLPFVESPLFAACRAQNYGVIKTLLEFKANPNYTSITTYGKIRHKETVVSVANATGDKEVMRLINEALQEAAENKKLFNKIKNKLFKLTKNKKE